MGRKKKATSKIVSAKKSKKSVNPSSFDFVISVFSNIIKIYLELLILVIRLVGKGVFTIVGGAWSYSKPIRDVVIRKVTLRINRKKVQKLLRLGLIYLKSLIKAVLYIPFKILKFELRFRLFSIKTSLFLLLLTFGYGFLLVYVGYLKDLPSVNQLLSHNQRLTTTIYDKKGNILYRVYDDEDRIYVPLNQIPRQVIDATIAIEDQDFFEHKGLSIKRITHSPKKNNF